MATERFEIVIDVRGLNQAGQQMRTFGQQAQQAQRHVQEFQSTLRFLRASLVAFASAKIAGGFLAFADTLTSVRNRLSQVAVTSGGVAEKQRELFDIARRSRTAFESVAILYTRTALSADNLTQSQAQLLKFTELTTKATAASGATASEAKNGLIQLAQGIASNRLGGDELRSVLENLTGVSIALAAGLDTTRGGLRKLAEQGGLTSDVIVKAILSQEEMIEKLFAKTIPTIGQAFEKLKNGAIESLGAFDNATGALRGIAAVVSFVADNLNILIGILVFFVARMLLVAKNSHMVAVALTTLRASAAYAVGTFAALSATFATTRAASGLLVASLVTLRTVVRSLFGPVGIALAIFGLMEFQGGATEAEKAIEKLAEQMDSLKKNFDVTTISVVGFNEETRKQAVTELSEQIVTLTDNLKDMQAEGENASMWLKGLRVLGLGGFQAPVQKMENELVSGRVSALFSSVDSGVFGQAGLLTQQFKEGSLTATDLIEKLEEMARQASGPTRDAILRLTVSFEGILQPQLQAEKGLRDAAFQMKVLTGAATEADYALAGFIQTAKNMSDAEILASLGKTDPLIKARTTAATENPILQAGVDRGLIPSSYGNSQIAANNSAVERLADPLGFEIKQQQERLTALKASTPLEKAVAEAQRLKLPLMEAATQEQIKQLANLYAQEDALTKGRRESESDSKRMERQYEKTRESLNFELSSLKGITGEAAAITRAKSRIADFDEMIASSNKETRDKATEILAIAMEIDRIETRRALNPIESAKADFAKAQAQIADLQGSGTIGQGEAAQMLAAQTEQYREALDPLRYFNDEMNRELSLIGMTDRERQIANTTRSVLLDLQAKGVAVQGEENAAVRESVELAIRRNLAAEEQKSLIKELIGDTAKHAEEVARLNEAMARYPEAAEQATRKMIDLEIAQTRFNTSMESGFRRGALQVLQEFTDSSELAAQTVVNGFKRAEDALVNFAMTGKLSFKELLTGLQEDLTRTFVREGIMKPLVTSLFGDMVGGSLSKPDGTSMKPFYVRNVDGTIPGSTAKPGGGMLESILGKGIKALFGGGFDFGAPGSFAAPDLSGLPVNNDFATTLASDLAGFASGGSFTVGSKNSSGSLTGMDNRLVRFRARDGEQVTVTPPGQQSGGGTTVIHMNIQTPDANSFAANKGQIMADMYAELSRQNARNR